jgi:PAP2 superfamily
VLLIAAFRGRWLFWPIAVLNSLVLLSCVTTGMHYFVDVLGGLIVTSIVIVATRPLLSACKSHIAEPAPECIEQLIHSPAGAPQASVVATA